MEEDAPTVLENREAEGERELNSPTPNKGVGGGGVIPSCIDNPAIPTRVLTQQCITRFLETPGIEGNPRVDIYKQLSDS